MTHSFVKTENGGWSDTKQSMPWEEIIQWQEKMFWMASYLYYVMDDPPFSDESYDAIIRILEAHYDELSPRLQSIIGAGDLKVGAYMLPSEMTDEEIIETLEWKKSLTEIK